MKEWNQILTQDVSFASRLVYCASSNKFIVNNSPFLSNPLSEFTPLKPVDAVSTFTGTSVKLVRINHKVSQ
jgi:hypothetical protein